MLKEGWQPLGGISVTTYTTEIGEQDWHAQALVQYEKKP